MGLIRYCSFVCLPHGVDPGRLCQILCIFVQAFQLTSHSKGWWQRQVIRL